MTSANEVPLRELDPCFEGGVPLTLCTCSASGVPNVGFLSLVHRIDDHHLALSFQYFRKTKQNLAENPRARLLVVEPDTAAEYRLTIAFVRTETEGEIFDRLAARLAAIASQTGMTESFSLRGADVYRVEACERCDNGVTTSPPVRSLALLSGLARCTAALSASADFEALFEKALEGLSSFLGYEHGFIMAADEAAGTLFSVASLGYSPSGVGAEVRFGQGLIGMAAERRRPVRIANMSRERVLAAAVRAQAEDDVDLERAIPMPGLLRTESQLVVPLLSEGHLLGVLCLQSEKPGAFGGVDEELVSVVAHQLATGMARLGGDALGTAEADSIPPGGRPIRPTLRVRHYAEDDSIFIDNEYLIKGLAGRILWLLLRSHEEEHRCAFSNKELRLDTRLALPPIKDNLETRLIMLRRRLEERCPEMSIRRTGRGRFELHVAASLELEGDAR